MSPGIPSEGAWWKKLHINAMVGKSDSARKWAVPWKSKATDFKEMEKELEKFLKNNT
ncbi:hypothetical protein AB0F64_12390 [Streptomyces sp. NPDC026294]|uniref:hypothetical protein n=1 Tax=Streptomyces sp. NPDC026294 TaxID=3155362 RepID=UPI0033E7CF3E